VRFVPRHPARDGLSRVKEPRSPRRPDGASSLQAWREGGREVVDPRWGAGRLQTAILQVRRAKNGTSATHPLNGREMRELRWHQRESPASPFAFVSERGAPLSAPGFSRMIERAAAEAGLGIKAHAHMLRHACGYKLANDGHDTRAIQAYMGHRNIQNTTRYNALAPERFKEFFRD
jgi:integrase